MTRLRRVTNHLFVVALLHKLDARFLKERQAEFVGVALAINNPFDAAVYDDFGANHAGLVRAVKRRAVYGYPYFGGLNYGVLLGVDGVTDFLHGAAGDSAVAPQAFLFFDA